MGSEIMTIRPISTMRMEMTMATIGRLMKNLAMGRPRLLPRATGGGRGALRRGSCGRGGGPAHGRGGLRVRGHGLDLLPSLHLVESLDNDPLAGLESLGNDPEGADAVPDLNLANIH